MGVSAWSRGPVAVVGGGGQIGRALRRWLEPLSIEVRSITRGADPVAALAGVDAVIHLAGAFRPRSPDTYVSANLESVRASLAALSASKVRRLVFMSHLAADAAAAHPYLRAKAEAERLLLDSGVPTVILRCAPILGPARDRGPLAEALTARDGHPVVLVGPPNRRVAPIYRDDLIEILVAAALDPGSPTGIFEIAGPQSVTLEEFASRLNGGDVWLRRLPAPLARLLPILEPSLPPALAELILRDCVPSEDPALVASLFGVRVRPIDETWVGRAGLAPVQ